MTDKKEQNVAVAAATNEGFRIYNDSRDMARITAGENSFKIPKKTLKNLMSVLESRVYIKADNVSGVEKVYINRNDMIDCTTACEYVEFSKLVEEGSHTAAVKKYNGKTKKFLTIFSVKKAGMKAREYYAASVVAVNNEGQEEWNLLLDFRKLYEMDDGVVRPTRSGITLSEKLSREVISSISDLIVTVNNFPASMKRKAQDNEDDVRETYKECRQWLKKMRNTINNLDLF